MGSRASHKIILFSHARLFDLFAGHLGLGLVDKGLEGHGAQVAVLAVAHGDGAVLLLLVAHHQHVGGLLQLGLPDLIADLLAAGVALHTQAGSLQLLLELLGIGVVALGDRQDHRLDRGQPQGETYEAFRSPI